jgi:predicted transport protein
MDNYILPYTTTYISNQIILNNRYDIKISDKGNLFKLDFKKESSKWLYGESDVEIGMTDNNMLSYISIEIKNGLTEKELKLLKRVIKNEETKYNVQYASSINTINPFLTVAYGYPDFNDKSNYYDIKINNKGNLLKFDFRKESSKWLYGESDVEIGITDNNMLSYISIEIKNGLTEKELKLLKRVIKNEETGFIC